MTIKKEKITDRKTYVSYKPYIMTNEWPGQARLNIFSTIEFTKDELCRRMDTLGAVDFIKRLMAVMPVAQINGRLNPWVYTSLHIELGFLVNSRIRKEKNATIEKKEDILDDIFTVTVNFPTCSVVGGTLKKHLVSRQKTFLVDLDEFARLLKVNGWKVSLTDDYNGHTIVKDTIEKGIISNPNLTIGKSISLNNTKELLTVSSYSMHPIMRKCLITSFLETFYPKFVLPDNLQNRQTTLPKEQKAQKLYSEYARLCKKDNLTHTDLDELVYLAEDFIYESTHNESSSYSSSLLYRLQSALDLLGYPLEEISESSLEEIGASVFLQKACISTPFELKKASVLDELKSYRRRFYDKNSNYERHSFLEGAYEEVLNDFEAILNNDKEVTFKKLKDDLAELNYANSKERTNFEDTCVAIAEELYERSTGTFIQLIEDLYNGSYDIALNWPTLQPNFKALGFEANTPEELLETLHLTIKELIIILKKVRSFSLIDKRFDYEILVTYLIDTVNAHLSRRKIAQLKPKNLTENH